MRTLDGICRRRSASADQSRVLDRCRRRRRRRRGKLG